MQSCSRFLTMYLEGNALLSFGQDDIFLKMNATLPNFLIRQIGGLLACVKFCLRRETFSGLLNFHFDHHLLKHGDIKYWPNSDKKTENLNFIPKLRGNEVET